MRYFTKRRYGWTECDTLHTLIPEDVLRVIEAPDLSVQGSRIFYDFGHGEIWMAFEYYAYILCLFTKN